MIHPGARLALLAGAAAAVLAASPVRAAEVVVTIKPLHALVARVMTGAGTPHLLVQGALSSHTYALKPSDAARLNASDLLFRMSDAMEPFTVRVMRTLPQRVQVVTLQDTAQLRLLPRRTGAMFAPAGGAADHRHANDHGHGHDATIDGHAWLDPINAKALADRIAEALSARSPAQAALFRANAARLKADLDSLNAELARDLGPVAGKPYRR